ncbi:hypothetical protein F4780DRAFT_770993 [Xylariomycetidae sp. FL0641]|nr:hypothetical protein F4780DRAFT_770993 [Xylariomycetidae sp. FL0641]
MLDEGDFQHAYTGRPMLLWKEGTIDDFIRATPTLSSAAFTQYAADEKLGTFFNARNIERIAGIKVKLTTNLLDHLLLREELKTVTIFHHASFLKHHQSQNALFPAKFVEETLQTLAILFPTGNRAVERWYRQLDSLEELDFAVFKHGTPARHLSHYHYWRDRLSILKDAFDEARPSTLAQWWTDRRDGAQWYTLWLAIGFTIFFGLVQSIEGAIQVYKALQD